MKYPEPLLYDRYAYCYRLYLGPIGTLHEVGMGKIDIFDPLSPLSLCTVLFYFTPILFRTHQCKHLFFITPCHQFYNPVMLNAGHNRLELQCKHTAQFSSILRFGGDGNRNERLFICGKYALHRLTETKGSLWCILRVRSEQIHGRTCNCGSYFISVKIPVEELEEKLDPLD